MLSKQQQKQTATGQMRLCARIMPKQCKQAFYELISQVPKTQAYAKTHLSDIEQIRKVTSYS
jgi:hypothetical protein